jgi:transcriptional regulator with XRE-family HTH domain/quercetin dioxygenase-like cupin family protein
VPAVGERLRDARLARGVGLRSLARDLGVSASLISQIETGKSQPSVSTLYAITSALGISIEYVFSPRGDPGPGQGEQTGQSPDPGAAAGPPTAAEPGSPAAAEAGPPATEPGSPATADPGRAVTAAAGPPAGAVAGAVAGAPGRAAGAAAGQPDRAAGAAAGEPERAASEPGRAAAGSAGQAGPADPAAAGPGLGALLGALGATRGHRVGPLVRPAQRQALTLDSGVTWQRLGHLPGIEVDFLLITYEPGGSSSSTGLLMRHSGAEYGYLLSGELLLTLGFDEHRLVAGDSICFESTQPHRYCNEGSVAAVGVWFVLGPG